MIIVIDALGLGIVTPVLAPMIRQLNSILGDQSSQLMTRQLLYGLIIAVFPICYIIGAPILGVLSDRWGRKSLLAISILGSLLGFISYALSLTLQNLALLLVGRILTGLTAGSQCIAQAAMVDISESNRDKAINISLIAIAMTVGLVLGPLLAGVLSNSKWIAWFDLSTPFYFVIGLCLLNLMLLIIGMQHTPKQPSRYQDQEQTKWGMLLSMPYLVNLLLVFFLFEIGWSLYYQALPLVWVHKFDASNIEVGLFLAYVGIVLCIGLYGLVRLATRYLSIINCVQSGLLVGGAMLILLRFIPNMWAQFIIAVPITFAVALNYSGLITLMSNQLSGSRQGLLMGVTDAALALAFACTMLLASWITYYALYIPFLLAGLVWWLALARLRARKTSLY